MLAPERRRERVAADRWRSHPVAGAAVRTLVVAVPLLAAVVAGLTMAGLLPAPSSTAGAALWWGVVLAASLLAMANINRVARRLLPLAALLRLSMLFPGEAPSRMRVARKAGGTRALQQRVDEARAVRKGELPARAAEIILTLVAALDTHDRRTRGHSERVHLYADVIAEELGLSLGERDRQRWVAMLHDVGKLSVSPALLNKPARLDADEWERVRAHPEEGARIVEPLRPWLGDEWIRGVAEHHERFDGTGYPSGLSGSDIALAARVIAVADSYEAMTAARGYHRPLGPAAAREELTRWAGSQFDPAIVRAFLGVSVARLRWMAGPLALIAQLPLIGRPALAATRGSPAQASVAQAAAAACAAVVVVGALGTPLSGAPAEVAVGGVQITAPEDPAPQDAPGQDAPGQDAPGEAPPVPAEEPAGGAAAGAQRAPVDPATSAGVAPAATAVASGTLDDPPADREALPDDEAPQRDDAPPSDEGAPAGDDPPRSADEDAPAGSTPAPDDSTPAPDDSALAPDDSTPPDEGPDDPPSDHTGPPASTDPRDDHATTAPGQPVTIDVLANDERISPSDPDLVVRVIAGPRHGTAVVNADRTITYTPEPGFTGADRFRYQLCRGDGGCGTATVTIDVV